MRELEFSDRLREIYAIFGKAYPAQAIVDAIYRQVQNFPDDFMAYAVGYCQNQTDLPRNLGLFLRQQVWPDYLTQNPQKRQAPRCCPDCNPDTPGFFLAWKPDGTSMLCICACNEHSGLESKMLGPISRRQVRELGLATEAVSAVVRQSPAVQARAQAALDSIGQMASQRPDHEVQLEEAAAW